MINKIKNYLNDTNSCIKALEKLKKENKISERSSGCLDTMLDVKDFLEPLLLEVKEYKKVKGIVVNIKNGQDSPPTHLHSIPSGGLVSEYNDRYEWDVISNQGLNMMRVYKKDFVSVEILL